MKVLEIEVGVQSYNFCLEADAKRVKHAERSLTDAAKEARSNIKSSRKDNEEENLNIEGQLYGPGIADYRSQFAVATLRAAECLKFYVPLENGCGHTTRNNTSQPFTANSMLALLQEAINNVQPEDWSKVMNKTERDIMSDWDRDIHIDNIMESSLIISVTDSDNEFSDNSDVSDSAMSLDE
ncbi:hypothetical protein EVAR_31353_1 [Eumeta japonica]|uniref:Uncharacterized protein n=1 Tax=Eumeta variegata TaxID=151549 RepID=A0A4C1XAX1_EUMVA|nr:hypothetical protein EVAR_31353_1 [Eumeta japonica]